MTFQELTARGPVLLDGATGSNLRRAGLPVGVCAEAWLTEHPEVILSLQRDYVAAGTQILYAPTFSCNRIALAGYGLEHRLEEFCARMVGLSRQAADGRALVAGDLMNVGRMVEPHGEMSYAELYDAYCEQISALSAAGVDLLVAETLLTVEEALAALDAAQSVCDLPVMCSMTVESDGSLLYGGSVMDAVVQMQDMGAAAVGVNCSVGPDQLEAVIGSIAKVAAVPVIAKPNAGLPVMDEQGQAHYSMEPEPFAASMLRLAERGATLLGGCCGTEPRHIAALRRALGK